MRRYQPASRPKSKPPRCPCHDTPGISVSIRKPITIATHRGIGTGIGKTKTFSLGVSMASAPPRAKTAPEISGLKGTMRVGQPIWTPPSRSCSITEVLPSMAIFREEVFGPVVCVNKFSTIEEAVILANSSDFALASSIWTGNDALAKGIARKINSGIVWVNTYGMLHNEIPYGGFKQSGFGKELGREGFLEYTRLKSVITDRTEGSKPIVNYWYGF